MGLIITILPVVTKDSCCMYDHTYMVKRIVLKYDDNRAIEPYKNRGLGKQ